jgi:Isoprenylcysteine carboxyl methyltransferase (ICMT) family
MNTTASTLPPAHSASISRFLSRRLLLNYFSTLAFVGLAYWIVSSVSGFHRSMLQAQWPLTAFGIDKVITIHAVLVTLIAIYAVVLIPYYATYPWMHSKAYTFIRGVWFALRRAPTQRARYQSRLQPMALPLTIRISPLTRQAGLALLLKFFFAPLMINWCLAHIANLCGSVAQLVQDVDSGVSGRALFDSSLFWAAFQLILFVDTLLFTLGYIIELPALGNRIRSVDPTFFGWFICLACYPPFNEFTMHFFAWESSDFPYFESNGMHFFANATLLLALAIFSWASVTLGFKASNLTNRGIVTHGPYKFVRHPAYAAKNLAWWLGALPTLLMYLNASAWGAFAYSLMSVFGWTAIYGLRAITEERHLRMLDNAYEQYADRVRWRFLPGVW